MRIFRRRYAAFDIAMTNHAWASGEFFAGVEKIIIQANVFTHGTMDTKVKFKNFTSSLHKPRQFVRHPV